MIHVEGAARAGFFPLRTEHEVINDELAFAVEEIRERLFAAGGIENVVLFDFNQGSWRRSAATASTLTSELLFAGE